MTKKSKTTGLRFKIVGRREDPVFAGPPPLETTGTATPPGLEAKSALVLVPADLESPGPGDLCTLPVPSLDDLPQYKRGAIVELTLVENE